MVQPESAKTEFLRGAFWAALPLPAFFAVRSWGVDALSGHLGLLGVVAVVTALHALTGLAARQHFVTLATLALTGSVTLAVAGLGDSPLAALFMGIVALAFLFLVWARTSRSSTHPLSTRLRGALTVGLGAGLWGVFGISGPAAWILPLCNVIALSWACFLLWQRRRGWTRSDQWLGSVVGAGLLAVGLLVPEWPHGLGILGFFSGIALVALPEPDRETSQLGEGFLDLVLGHPTRFLVVTFLALCSAGTLLLALPWSTPRAEHLPFIDAAFTAVSAVCVTGLNVLDVPRDFSVVGQLFILLLMQAGGLGIMTFSTAAMRLLGQRISLRHEGALAGLLSPQDQSALFKSAQNVLTVTFLCEAVGAVLLCMGFLAAGLPLGEALWKGLFTAVSAFCNAGFALESTNLIPFQTGPLVLHTVAALIILGGLTPVVATFLPARLLGQRKPHLGVAQRQMILVTTACLLLAGFVGWLLFEWNGALAGLSWTDRFHNAWLQSATLRTAGFNSVPLEALQPTTLTIMMVLMFIGGSPGGTAGGIKTTTFATLGLAVLSAIAGRAEIEVFKRRISHRTVYRATAITTVYAGATLVFFLLVLQTQDMPVRMALFEVISALGTVGLTIGGTPRLDDVGKGLIMACMFLGRVGPLTLFLFLSRRNLSHQWKRPEEDIEVG